MLKARINILAYAGVAKPNPKMGQALGPLGINMMQFCKDFNSKTTQFTPDTPLRIKLQAFTDRTYKYIIKPPPTAWFIKKAMGAEKLSGHRSTLAGQVSVKYIYEIAKIKKELDPDLKDIELEAICRMIAAQCKGMGVITVFDSDKPEIVKPKINV